MGFCGVQNSNRHVLVTPKKEYWSKHTHFLLHEFLLRLHYSRRSYGTRSSDIIVGGTGKL